jgi:uncharacterized membrane protein YphA (DoxX/SURF4 family)
VIERCSVTLCHDRLMASSGQRHDGSVASVAAQLARGVIAGPDALIRRDRRASRVAILAGVIFFFAGLVKFVFHHWELHAFESFGLPWPSALEILAGVLETAGGVALVARRWVVPTAALLAVTMVVAIVSSGIGHGDVIPSLTLAPMLLAAMLYLLAIGMRDRPALVSGPAPS